MASMINEKSEIKKLRRVKLFRSANKKIKAVNNCNKWKKLRRVKTKASKIKVYYIQIRQPVLIKYNKY